MEPLNFLVSFAPTLDESTQISPSITIYSEDINLCDFCLNETGSCWACIQITQQVFSDSTLTTPVDDGYYSLIYDKDGRRATWYIIGGYPQEGGFYN